MTELMQGAVLMVAGMGIVYVFLSVLIVVTRSSMGLISRFDGILPQEAPKKRAPSAAAQGDDADIALAIAVAMNG